MHTVARLIHGFICASLALIVAAAALGASAAYADNKSRTSYIVVIIDDVGNSWSRGLQAIGLPGPVAISVIPDLPYSTQLAQQAYNRRKDVMLHMPMEPVKKKELLSPGGLRTDMTEPEVFRSLENGLSSVPHAVAINNHMGSQYTRNKQALKRLMVAIRAQNPNLFFIDSLTTARSKVKQQATAYGIPSLARDVFLDNVREESAIEQQFDQVIAIARKRGYAIAIGHPFQETLDVLQRRLPSMSEGAVRLVPLTMLVAMNIQEREPWR
jgi:polysaccharide deacetylase 2 family uncharacterized protein YibQ